MLTPAEREALRQIEAALNSEDPKLARRFARSRLGLLGRVGDRLGVRGGTALTVAGVVSLPVAVSSGLLWLGLIGFVAAVFGLVTTLERLDANLPDLSGGPDGDSLFGVGRR
jgi:hypothetical protein